MNRVFNLAQKYCGGKVPNLSHDLAFSLPFDIQALLEGVEGEVRACNISTAVYKSMEAARATNR
ncbi:hypothetical protein EON63_11165 [archaeon]|nr:MAG: hypothetical protein EON63_11165 [archaeon]